MSDLSHLSDDELLALHEKQQGGDLGSMSDADLLKLADQHGIETNAGISKTESGLRGAGQGATLGFQDELSGATEAALGAGQSALTGENNFGDQGHLAGLQNLLENYRRARDTQRQQNEAAQQANPGSYLAGNVLGSVPLAIATGGGGLASEAGAGAKLYSAAQTGARIGATAGLGSSNADLTTGDPSQYLQSAEDLAGGGIIGAATGGATELGLQGLGNSRQGVADYFENKGNDLRIKSLGGTAGEYKKLYNNDQIDSLGQYLKDRNIVGPFTSHEGIAENLANDADRSGELIDNIVKSADAQMSGASGAIPAEEISQEARQTILDPLLKEPFTARAAKNVSDLIEDFESKTEGQYISAQDLQRFKRRLKIETKIFERAGDDSTAQGYKDLYSLLNKKAEDIVQSAETALKGTPNSSLPEGSFETFKEAKSDYGNALQAEKLNTGKLGRTASSQPVSLGSKVLMAGGYAKGGKWGAAAMGALNNVATKYTAPVGAAVYGGISDILNSSPQIFGKYSAPLLEAAQKGAPALTATDFVMSQTYPDYRAKRDEILQNQQGGE